MATLQHITNSEAGREAHEVFYASKFTVEIIPPPALQVDINTTNLIMNSVNSISGLETDKSPGVIQIQFGGAGANYAGGVIEDTTFAFSMTFPLLLRGENRTDFYTYDFFKSWLSLIHNPRTGEQNVKRDYIGEVIVTNVARGQNSPAFWIRKFKNVFIAESLPALDLDKANPDATEFEVSFVADYIEDEQMA